MAENIQLANFTFDVSAVVKNAQELKEALEKVKGEQAILKLQGEQTSAAFVENEAKLKALNGEYRRNQAILVAQNKGKLDQINRTERITTAIAKEAVTIDQLRQKNKELNTLRNSANISTEKGRKELELLNNQLDKNNEQIKENVDAYTQQKINIGNYQGALGALSPQLNAIVNQGKTLISGLNGLKVALAGNAKGLKLFRIALISTGIGAIVVLLGAAVAAFAGTRKGADTVTRALGPLKEIFNALVGVLQEFGGAVVAAFSNPKKAIEDFASLIKTNITNRIDGVIETFGILGTVIKEVFSGEFEKAGETAKGLQESIIKSATGVENLVGKVKGLAEEAGEFLQKNIDRGNKIAELTIQQEKDEIAIIELRAKNLRIIKQQELISKDQLNTDADRLAALELATKLTKDLEQAELAVLDTKIELKELSQEANDTDRDELRALAELKAQRDENQRRTITTEIKFLGTKKQLNDNALKRVKEAQALAIKNLNEDLALFVAVQGTKAKTLEEELAIADQVALKKKEILQAEFESGKITAQQLATAKQNLENEALERTAEIAVDNAAREIDAYRTTAEKKLEIDNFLSESELLLRQTTLDELALKDKEFLDLKLENGTISQTEYNDAINAVNEENRISNEELAKERAEVKKQDDLELNALAFEEELLLLEEQGVSRLAIQQKIDEEKRNVELAALDKSEMSEELYNANVEAINKRYERSQQEREQIIADQKVQLTQQLLGSISGLIDKNSVAGKAVAIAQAGINTYQGITKALAETTDPSPTQSLRFANAIAVGITGLAAVKKIISTKTPGGGGGGSSANLTLPKSTIGGIDNAQAANLTSSSFNGVQGDVDGADNAANANTGIKDAVEQGAKAGTQAGASEGLTNLTENKSIQTLSAF
ncbi:hypothetical protein OAD61_00195 [bacterium]|nr:hypothetical protein [bacterium]